MLHRYIKTKITKGNKKHLNVIFNLLLKPISRQNTCGQLYNEPSVLLNKRLYQLKRPLKPNASGDTIYLFFNTATKHSSICIKNSHNERRGRACTPKEFIRQIINHPYYNKSTEK